jgi:hypothetical protein
MTVATRIDIERLLVWAYRDECADHGSDELVGFAGGYANPVYGMASLGMRVDGGGSGPTRIPEDALAVDAAVSRLPGHQRRLVVQHAKAGTRPDIRWLPPRGFRCDLWGHPTGKPRHFFHPSDKKKRRPTGCYVRFSGDSLQTLRVKWLTWLNWWEGLGFVDQQLRQAPEALKRWELADFAVPQYPWSTDPSVPHWLWERVFLTWD